MKRYFIAAPVAATVASAPVSATPASAPSPRQAPKQLPGQKEEGRPFWMSDEDWIAKPKVDKIITTFPAPDREYPELTSRRFWTGAAGQKWDVCGQEKPADEGDRKSVESGKMMYDFARRDLLEKWGLLNIMADTSLKYRYTLADEFRRPLMIDLDETIAKHLT